MYAITSVMVSALCDDDGVISHLVDQAVLAIDTTRPIACPLVTQRFRRTNTLEWLTLDIRYQHIDTLENAFIRCLPIQVIFPGMGGPQQIHSSSNPWEVVSPALMAATA